MRQQLAVSSPEGCALTSIMQRGAGPLTQRRMQMFMVQYVVPIPYMPEDLSAQLFAAVQYLHQVSTGIWPSSATEQNWYVDHSVLALL